MKNYDPDKIEKKWQKAWEKLDLYKAKDFSKKPKYYVLVEFPYPSGDGLHIGHLRSYTALDVISRKKRMEGYNVLYPIGWDAFGLPTENYAIRTGIHPEVATKRNVAIFTRQLKSLGLSFDWSREIDTTDPKYYKWTQWIFLKFFEKGLAYQAKMPINWCPSCKIGLANEEVIDGKCERCGAPAGKKELKQWLLKITAYADKLIKGLEGVDYPERVKASQINWIGRSEGVEVNFPIVILNEAKRSEESNKPKNVAGVRSFGFRPQDDNKVVIFTTRVDTIFGVTALVLAPENQIVEKLKTQIKNWDEVKKYIEQTEKKSDLQRTSEAKERTGIELKGIQTINPANNEKVPVWIADYVLAHYGGGAVMMVPAHDKRDWDFAKKYNLPIREIVIPNRIDKRNPPVSGKKTVERKNVHAIVRNPKNNKFLCLKSEKFSWITFPMGGVDENEDVIEAARREVEEETGYKNLKLVKVLGGEVRAEYFAKHKDENRVAYTTAVLFDLIDEEKSAVDKEWQDLHEAMWIDESDVNCDIMVHAEMYVWIDRLKGDKQAYTEDGFLVNSGQFSGLTSAEAREKMAEWLKKNKIGGKVVKFHLRDWIFSRQHYWGEPIPIIHCAKCARLRQGFGGQGAWPVPEKDLPVKLPYVEKYQPTDTGESPLAVIKEWVNTKCPKCGGPAKRETDTMPNWAGSSWYFLRYIDSKNNKAFADDKKLKYWLQPARRSPKGVGGVDLYNGGMEHTTLHLLYSRFWHKFMYDLGLVPTSEPYAKRTSHGIVLAEDGRKMSKSWGNVINPDEMIKIYGADAVRIYEMFMGPFEQAISWNSKGLKGCYRFLGRVWNLFYNQKDKIGKTNKEMKSKIQQLVKKIDGDLKMMKFNTAIAGFMEFVNSWMGEDQMLFKKDAEIFLKTLSPFAPHLTEELWSKLGHKKSIFYEEWPKYDPRLIMEETFELVIQINGKVRDKVEAPIDISEDEAKKLAMDSEKIKRWIEGKNIRKVIFVRNKLINIII